MSKERLVELVCDAGRFGGRDTDVCMIHAVFANVAAYLPPEVLREFGWRRGAAGSTMSDADLDQFGNTGFVHALIALLSNSSVLATARLRYPRCGDKPVSAISQARR